MSRAKLVRNERINMPVGVTSVSAVSEAARKVLQDAGKEGIKARDFFNHESLSGFSHAEIDQSLEREMNAANVVLGAVATKYFWIS